MAKLFRTKPKTAHVPVVDLFAGPGGLGEGFSAQSSGKKASPFRIALSIEKDATAHKTLELRAFFRQFAPGDAPKAYYDVVRGLLTREELRSDPTFRSEWRMAESETWNVELGAHSAARVRERVRLSLGKRVQDSVLIGGPPCQAYSLVGRSRNIGNPDYDASTDGRHTLYREYLKVLTEQRPAVFVMENVKGLLSAQLDGQKVFNLILDDLREPFKAVMGRKRTSVGERYSIHCLSIQSIAQPGLFDRRAQSTLVHQEDPPSRFILRCEEFGIPQARHRLILIGVREDATTRRLQALAPHAFVTAGAVLNDLPKLRSGISGGADSAESWIAHLDAALSSRWFLWVLDSLPDVAIEIQRAVAVGTRRHLTRGSEYMDCSSRPSAYDDWYKDSRLDGVANHSTRSHMAGDLHRYLFAAAYASTYERSPSLRDFPPELLPDHQNVRLAVAGGMFGDRFRVQLSDRPSATVTSHISKDGHYYIHPDASQCRSLTAREAARLQTFPDNYFFCGGRTAQYHQIGNAVPPLMARQIAQVVSTILGV